MATGLLSLKWNNHKSTFFHVLSTIRSKESYCDVTLACDGRFYALHKFVLSTCSEYFEEMFERAQCKHPVIVLKDIKYDDLEALLNYMYVGEVNVVQEKLAGLIKAAECLKIKGLAVPDEDPMENKESLGREQQQHKRSQRTEDSPRAKRRRRENSTDVLDSHNPARSRYVARSRNHNSNLSSKTNIPPSEENQHLDAREDEGQDSGTRVEENSYNKESRQTNASDRSNKSPSSQKNKNEPEEVILDDDEVKPEPIDPPPDEEDIENHEGEQDNKDALHQELGFDSEGMAGDNNYDDMGDQLQNMEDVVADAMPGSSGYQENSFPMWEGEGSLSNFPVEGFSGDNSQARQMVIVRDEEMADNSFQSRDWSGGGGRGPHNPSASLCPPNTHYSKTHQSSNFSLYDFLPMPGANTSSQAEGVSGGDGEVKAFVCTYCSYQTNVKTNFRVHLRTHTGEKPYACPFCPYRSSHKSNLKAHSLRHEALRLNQDPGPIIPEKTSSL